MPGRRRANAGKLVTRPSRFAFHLLLGKHSPETFFTPCPNCGFRWITRREGARRALPDGAYKKP
jgi:hypothetical protein